MLNGFLEAGICDPKGGAMNTLTRARDSRSSLPAVPKPLLAHYIEALATENGSRQTSPTKC
jgi:hypothetical protein